MFGNLKYIEPIMREAIENDEVAGSQVAVIHKGETIYRENFGMADKEKGIKMADDNIFRLFSLTKPVTAAAAMILLERGKLELRFPVKWFLPTFDNPMVLDENGLRPAQRDITLRDLLNMTSGICYPGGSPAGQKMGEIWGRVSYDQETKGSCMNTHEFALEMGKAPLSFSPGERWEYGASADIMGAVVEVISGMTLGEFFRKEIFEPLGMNETGFYIPEDKYSRLTKCYNRTEEGNMPYSGHDLCLTDCRRQPDFESGGAGLVSTIDDYSRFVKMLMNKGSYNGVRILGRKTVELMTADGLNDIQRASLDWDSMLGHGYGNFMRVLRDPSAAGLNGSKGEYGWDGWLGCYFNIDPAEELAYLYFIQQTNSGCTSFTRRMQNVIWAGLN